MARWATGKRSQAISDRSGMAFPYKEMVKEWNGSFVHYSEFEPKHPQIRRKHNTADAIALQNTRSQKFQTPKNISSINPQAPNDNTIASSGGQGMITANLSLPGDFAFINQGTSAMIPADPSLQNRGRELNQLVGQVQINIVSATLTTYTVTVASTGSGNKYFIDGSQQATLNFVKNNIYKFDQSNASNSNHPLRFSTTSGGSHSGGTEYTTGVVIVGTPGTAGAYTQITVDASAPSTLYYYCTNHSGMGGQINIT